MTRAATVIRRCRFDAPIERVRRSDYLRFFSSLPVNEGARRGYNLDRTPEPGLLESRRIILAAMRSILHPAGGRVDVQHFKSNGYCGQNIIGVLPGRGEERRQQYIIGAHYDAGRSPGADDNASGVAGMLTAAHVLSQFRFNATLVFMAFDLEESHFGLQTQGSKFYADQARKRDHAIAAMISLDMIAYNHRARGVVTTGVGEESFHRCSGDLISQITGAFDACTRLKPALETCLRDSDHWRFALAGYPAAYIGGQLTPEGRPANPHWERPADYYRNVRGQPQRLDDRPYLDFDYAAAITRAVVHWAAGSAVLR